MSGMVWYGGFGSNLDDDRFACYLAGGSVPGLSLEHPGCRDRTPAREVVTCVAAGRMRFAGHVAAWGSGGGVSSFEPSSDRAVLLRAFRISVPQMVDVLLQENRLTPGSLPDLSRRLERRVDAAWVTAESGVVRLDDLLPGARYDRLHMLRAYGFDGVVRKALLLGSSVQERPNRPSDAYLGTLRRGLRRSCGLSVEASDAYLAACLEGTPDLRVADDGPVRGPRDGRVRDGEGDGFDGGSSGGGVGCAAR